jgi:ABC-type antimicrobial peptide transport system permease subunit
VVNGAVLKPLMRVNMDGLMRVFDSGPGDEPLTALTNSTYSAWREAPSTIEGLAAWDSWSQAFEGPSGLELIRGAGIEDVITMETRLMRSLARPRLYAVLLGGFAAFATLIAVIGLFGGLSYGVAQRTREFAIRTALGATPRNITALVMRQGTTMILCGLAAGFGAAAATVKYLSGFLFGVPPLDAATFVLAAVTLTAVALLACAIPARRAARLDAIDALRR